MLKNGRFVTYRAGIARAVATPHPQDILIGYLPNGCSLFSGVKTFAPFRYVVGLLHGLPNSMFTLTQAIEYIAIEGWDVGRSEAQCECGSEKARVAGHSSYCPKYSES